MVMWTCLEGGGVWDGDVYFLGDGGVLNGDVCLVGVGVF